MIVLIIVIILVALWAEAIVFDERLSPWLYACALIPFAGLLIVFVMLLRQKGIRVKPVRAWEGELEGEVFFCPECNTKYFVPPNNFRRLQCRCVNCSALLEEDRTVLSHRYRNCEDGIMRFCTNCGTPVITDKTTDYVVPCPMCTNVVLSDNFKNNNLVASLLGLRYGRKRTATVIVICIMAIAAFFLVMSILIPPDSTPSETSIAYPAAEMSDDYDTQMAMSTISREPDVSHLGRYAPPSSWHTYNPTGAYTITIPPSMVLEAPSYRVAHNLPPVDAVFRQTEKSAYSRVLMETIYEGGLASSEEYAPFTQADLFLLGKRALQEAYPYTILDGPEFQWVDIDGTKAIHTYYQRTGVERTTARTNIYLFLNKNYFVKVTIVYREGHSGVSEKDLSNVIRTFKWLHKN